MGETKSRSVGRPLKYKNAEALQQAIDEYFDYCDNKMKDMESEKLGTMTVPDPQPYTVAGLAYHLGFVDRRSFLDYKGRDEFSLTIQRARFRIEQDLERRLLTKELFTPGIIFNQKNNFDYVEKVQQDGTQKLILETRRHSRLPAQADSGETEDGTADDDD